MVLDEHVLILNKNWLAVDSCTVAVAFSKLFSGSAKFLEIDNYTLHGVDTWISLNIRKNDVVVTTAKSMIRVPDVMVLRNAAKPKRVMRFSRRNLMRRDHYRCQYCGDRDDLTIDHVVPESRGGKKSWMNCVISCVACNSKKGNKSIDDVGMSLIPRADMMAMYPNDKKRWTVLYEPAWSPVFRVPPNKLKESWFGFLPDNIAKGHVVD